MAGLTKSDSSLLVWDPSKTALQVKLGELVQYFQVGIATTPDGIPKCYIDPTQILPQLMTIDTPDDLPDDIVEAAKIAIDFEDGFPTVEGIPFWERLEGEPIPYYNLFKQYREMKYIGTEKAECLLSRSIARLSTESQMTGRQLNALSRVYHWQIRAKSFDTYKAAERNLMKQHEVELLESKHAKVSNDLLDQAVDYLLKHPEQLNPRTAIDLARLAMEAGRISVGLNPDKPGSSSGSGSGGTHVSIVNQNASATEGGQVNMANLDLSEVEKKTQENSQKPDHLQSILHVLNASGAFGVAAGQDKDNVKYDEDGNIVEAEYEEV